MTWIVSAQPRTRHQIATERGHGLHMFNFNMVRDAGRTLMCLKGSLAGEEDSDVLKESFAFVPPDDHLVLDMTELNSVDDTASVVLKHALTTRAVMAETVVVSPNERVSMQLVLNDVDRVTPIVPRLSDALSILDTRWSARRQYPRVP